MSRARLEVEDLVHAKQLEDRERLIARTADRHGTARCANTLVELHERGDTRAVDEVESRQVDNNCVGLLRDDAINFIAELRSCVDIERATDRERGGIVRTLDIKRG